jgi:hypothetical protein
VSCFKEEEDFWDKLHLHGHMGEGNSGNENVIGKFGYGTLQEFKGETVVDFAECMDLVVVNIFFKN